jgi:hypothetical protein
MSRIISFLSPNSLILSDPISLSSSQIVICLENELRPEVGRGK